MRYTILVLLRSRSTSRRRRIFPEADLGIASTNSTYPEPLVVRDLGMDEGVDLFFRQRVLIRRAHDDGLGHLARVVVEPGSPPRRRCGCVSSSASSSAGATWKPFTLMSSFSRSTIKIEASSLDHADVARVQPTVRVDRAGSGLGVVQIPFHHLRAANPDLAGLIRGEIAPSPSTMRHSVYGTSVPPLPARHSSGLAV